MLLLFVVAAHAATVSNCSSGDAPAGYTSYSCAGVCEMSDSVTVSCYPSNEIGGFCEETAGAEAWIVSEYSDSSYENFSAFGTTSDGVPFCCFVDDSADEVYYVKLYGGAGEDTLGFMYGGADLHAYISGEVFSGSIFGGACADSITGSDDLNLMWVGLGTDTLWGEGGSDTIWGEKGPDQLYGGSGNDDIYGMGGNDLILGGSGTDYLSGAAGTNTLCAGTTTEADYFVAVGASTFWAPGSGTAPTGSAPAGSACGSHHWGSSWAGSGCTYSWFMTAPSSC